MNQVVLEVILGLIKVFQGRKAEIPKCFMSSPDLFKSDGPHVVDHDRPEHGAEAAPPEHRHRHEVDDARQAAIVKICYYSVVQKNFPPV